MLVMLFHSLVTSCQKLVASFQRSLQGSGRSVDVVDGSALPYR